MSMMEYMRQFSAFKQEKELEEATQAAEEADREFLRDKLIKFVYKDEIVDQVLPAMELLHQYELSDSILELLAFKESEIQKLVEHKEFFEQQTSEADHELDAEAEEEQDLVDLVDQYLNDKYSN
ncbi:MULTISPECIES: hypothetical protein [unclassified Halomonas]|uniref:hypothetical protein n=1 Tax=unclassified Halomonas TaxID=2609666 RepID=UPI000D3621DE|nr:MULTISPECIES: hypothetical protein [unclassified Halomonas]